MDPRAHAEDALAGTTHPILPLTTAALCPASRVDHPRWQLGPQAKEPKKPTSPSPFHFPLANPVNPYIRSIEAKSKRS